MNNDKSELSIDKHGTKFWYLNGKRHKEDGPAVITFMGHQKWYLNGLLHREDGPAIKYVNGSKEWWLNGERHREDGPAVLYNNGTKLWFLNDKKYTYEEWFSLLTPEQQMNYLWNLDEE